MKKVIFSMILFIGVSNLSNAQSDIVEPKENVLKNEIGVNVAPLIDLLRQNPVGGSLFLGRFLQIEYRRHLNKRHALTVGLGYSNYMGPPSYGSQENGDTTFYNGWQNFHQGYDASIGYQYAIPIKKVNLLLGVDFTGRYELKKIEGNQGYYYDDQDGNFLMVEVYVKDEIDIQYLACSPFVGINILLSRRFSMTGKMGPIYSITKTQYSNYSQTSMDFLYRPLELYVNYRF